MSRRPLPAPSPSDPIAPLADGWSGPAVIDGSHDTVRADGGAGAPSATPTRRASDALPGIGWPHDRHTALAARRAFGELRQTCLRAAQSLPVEQRRACVELIGRAGDLAVLTSLQQAVLEALDAAGPTAERARRELRQAWSAIVQEGLAPPPPR